MAKRATITGKVAVQNEWGFLPPSEYYQRHLFGFCTLAYICAALGWSLVIVRWWKNLFVFHRHITIVTWIAVLEASLWWIFYVTWNSTGTRGHYLLGVADLVTVGKLAWALWSFITLPDRVGNIAAAEDLRMYCPIFLVLYMASLMNLRLCLALRRSLEIHSGMLAASSVLVIVIAGILFFQAFKSTAVALEYFQGKEDIMTKILKHTRILLGLVVSMAGVATVVQLIDPTMSSDPFLWKYSFIVSDGVVQIPFLLFLIAMMVVWHPNEGIRPYEGAPTEQGDSGNVIGAPAELVFGDDDLDDEEETIAA